MRNYWKVVNQVIKESDVLLLILDARFIDETRNPEIEEKVKNEGKPLIYVITKSDLAPRQASEDAKRKLSPSVFVSARDHHGSIRLKERIIIEGNRAYGKKESYMVGVLGYPNVGKSSLINLMRGRHSASTSALSGHTKGVQWIRSDSRIMFIDTPGVIPFGEEDEAKHVAIGTVDFTKARDPDLAVMELMRRLPGKFEAYYGVPAGEDMEATLEAIALKRNVLMTGGVADVMRMARTIIRDFQMGKIR